MEITRRSEGMRVMLAPFLCLLSFFLFRFHVSTSSITGPYLLPLSYDVRRMTRTRWSDFWSPWTPATFNCSGPVGRFVPFGLRLLHRCRSSVQAEIQLQQRAFATGTTATGTTVRGKSEVSLPLHARVSEVSEIESVPGPRSVGDGPRWAMRCEERPKFSS